MASKQKWALPFRRNRVNYEDVGYAPYYLQHDVGFSGRKIYRPVKRDGSHFILKGNYGMTRKDAVDELKRLAGSQQNPAVSLPRNKWINASIRITSDGKIQAKVSSPVLSRSIRKKSNPRRKNPKGVSESWLNQPDTEATKRKMMKLAKTSKSLKVLYKVYVWAGAWNQGGDVFVGNEGIRYVIHNRLKKHGMTDREAFGRFGL